MSKKFKRGDFVRKIKGSSWRGTVVGEYSTSLTPEGYAVESDTETGSVQIYPASALEIAEPPTPAWITGRALRKLDGLLDAGYRINGVAIRRDGAGMIPKQGFVTDAGMVGWWPQQEGKSQNEAAAKTATRDEMLDALRDQSDKLLEALRHCCTEEGPEQEWLDIARAAIAKAEGGAA